MITTKMTMLLKITTVSITAAHVEKVAELEKRTTKMIPILTRRMKKFVDRHRAKEDVEGGEKLQKEQAKGMQRQRKTMRKKQTQHAD